jgi:hypothetical protein
MVPNRPLLELMAVPRFLCMDQSLPQGKHKTIEVKLANSFLASPESRKKMVGAVRFELTTF